MSKLKTPNAKKTASLKRDRRHASGHNGKAAKTVVPREKARTHRELRRAVHQAIAPAELVSDEGVQQAENAVTKAARDAKSRGFRKQPDVPLGDYLDEKKQRRGRGRGR